MTIPYLNGKSSIFAFWGIILLGLGILILYSASYLPFFEDDSFISLRYVKRFLDGKGLTWNDGERVEGYSNLLWILLISGLGYFHINLIFAARLLGLFCMSAAIIAVAYTYRPSRIGSIFPALVGVIFLSVESSIAVYAIGGLEDPLVAALLAWSLAFCLPLLANPTLEEKDAWIPGSLLAFLCITRPDGIVFSASLAISFVICQKRDWKTLKFVVLFLLPSIVFYLGQLAFRLWYYGEWFPNPAFVKISLSYASVHAGIGYMLRAMYYHFFLLVPTACSLYYLIKIKKQTKIPLFLSVPFCFWVLYLIIVGGDIFPAFRRTIPLVVISAFLIAEGVNQLTKSLFFSYKKLMAVVIFCSCGLLTVQAISPTTQLIYVEAREWIGNGQVIGKFLKKAFKEPPLIAVDAAGSVPYFSDLPAIDMLGLNDYHIARAELPKVGRGWLSHNHGDGAYVLKKKPDLIIMGWPGGGIQDNFPGDAQLLALPEFTKLYALINFEGNDPHPFVSQIWVRKDGGVVGIQKSSRQITIPAYLLSANTTNVTRLLPDNLLGTTLSKNQPLEFKDLFLPEGTWTVKVQASQDVHLTLLTEDKKIESTFELTKPSLVTVILDSELNLVYVYRIEFTKL